MRRSRFAVNGSQKNVLVSANSAAELKFIKLDWDFLFAFALDEVVNDEIIVFAEDIPSVVAQRRSGIPHFFRVDFLPKLELCVIS